MLFTRDLRVHDHPALDAAVRSGEPVVPLFVLDPGLLGRSANRQRFLMESLVDLDRSLARCGSGLIVREGDPVARVLDVVSGCGAQAVHLSSDVSRTAQRREGALRAALAAHGVDLVVHPGNAVVEPGEVVPPGKDMLGLHALPPRVGTGAATRRIGSASIDRDAVGHRSRSTARRRHRACRLDRSAPGARPRPVSTSGPTSQAAHRDTRRCATISPPTRPRACRRTCGSAT